MGIVLVLALVITVLTGSACALRDLGIDRPRWL